VAGPQKIIIDSDYNTMSDDGQLGVMAAQLQAQGKVRVMGITVVSGNQWLKQGVADALKSVERLGVGGRIGVYAGANYALNHDYATIEAEMAAGAGGDGYLGAWNSPEPKSDADLKPSPDGFATHTKVQAKSAVDFIIETVKANPGQITILAIGPLTNIALAVQRSPDIVPLIKQIIYMGGAVHVAGNTTKAAEFNWWFDPEAAQFVVRQPIKQVVVPLDVTDTVFLTKPIYDRVAHPAKPTAVTEIYRKLNGYGFSSTNGFENNPNYTQNI
jgi:inosine-uridine nucleoside N-ribohydrolase